MSRYYYDLHIHSCLSPCADDDMTPANIAGMAMLNGLGIVALTDHNTSKNCPAFFHHAKQYGLVPVAGMELTTSEDIHVICLFPDLESAMEFDSEVEKNRIHFENKPEIFGNQLIMDENDAVCGTESDLLINATMLDLQTAYDMCNSLGGVCYPAHIDRQSNGIIAVLGTFPEEPDYTAYELNSKDSFDVCNRDYPSLARKKYLVSSDAHALTSISGSDNYLELDDEPYSSAKVRQSLISFLKGEQ